MKFSVCTEIICAGVPFCEAIETLHNMNIKTIEFWGWANKDLDTAKQLLEQYNMNVSTFCVDSTNPAISGELARGILTGGQKEAFLDAVKESTTAAKKMGTDRLIITLGLKQEGLSYEEMMQNIRDCLLFVKDYLEENQMILLLEPINLGERPLYIEPKTAPTFAMIREINSPSIKMLYDMYHQALTGDLSIDEITENIDCIGHFHVADAPDRHEPGTGKTDFTSLFAAVRNTGYNGYIGLEFRPSGPFSDIIEKLKSEEKNKAIEKIVQDLRKLGLNPGDTVIVHSSLSALGYVEGGACTVIDALKTLLTPEGTLLFPALSYSTVNQENPHFDVRTEPVCVGHIPDTFRKLPDSIRSLHPTHSVCAWGKYARELTCDHHLDNTPVGPHSPYRKLPAYGGKVLMLGCRVGSFTFMHGMEEAASLGYILTEEPWHYTLTDYEGNIIEKDIFRHNFGPQNLSQRYDRILDVLSPEEYSVGSVLNGTAHLFDTRIVMERALETMKKDPYFFVDGHNK